MGKPTSARAAIALGLVAAGLSLNSPAQSCAIFKPFRLEIVKTAAAVFRGQLVDYALVRHPRGFDFATLTFKIADVYRGERHDTLKLSWPNSTFGLPQKWNGPTDLIVAAELHGNDLVNLYGQRFGVLQEPCSDAFLLGDTQELRDKVRALVGQ